MGSFSYIYGLRDEAVNSSTTVPCGTQSSTERLRPLKGIARSETLEECEKIVSRPESPELPPTLGRSSHLEDLLLKLQIRVNVDLRRFDRLMTQPQGDDRTIYARLEQIDGVAVASMPRSA